MSKRKVASQVKGWTFESIEGIVIANTRAVSRGVLEGRVDPASLDDRLRAAGLWPDKAGAREYYIEYPITLTLDVQASPVASNNCWTDMPYVEPGCYTGESLIPDGSFYATTGPEYLGEMPIRVELFSEPFRADPEAAMAKVGAELMTPVKEAVAYEGWARKCYRVRPLSEPSIGSKLKAKVDEEGFKQKVLKP